MRKREEKELKKKKDCARGMLPSMHASSLTDLSNASLVPIFTVPSRTPSYRSPKCEDKCLLRFVHFYLHVGSLSTHLATTGR